MYNREDYREALEEREKCDLHSDEWRFCQAKVQSIATAMVAAGNNWMVGEIIDELYSLSDCGCELTDEAVRFDLWILEVLKKLRDLEAEMEEAENQSEYWMEEEHLDMEKSNSYEAEADRLYQEVYKMHNQVADFIVSLTSGQIDKVTAMLMMRQRRSDVERILEMA